MCLVSLQAKMPVFCEWSAAVRWPMNTIHPPLTRTYWVRNRGLACSFDWLAHPLNDIDFEYHQTNEYSNNRYSLIIRISNRVINLIIYTRAHIWFNAACGSVCISASHLDDCDDDDVVYYVLLRAVDRFFSEFNKYPGFYKDAVDFDIPNLKVSRMFVRLPSHIDSSVRSRFNYAIVERRWSW